MITPQKTLVFGNSERKTKNLFHNFIMRLYKMGKRATRFFAQFSNHLIDAGYDFYRYLRFSSLLPFSSNDPKKLEVLLFFYYHKIEKALSLPKIKPLFGLGYITTTLDLVDQWAKQTRDFNAVPFRAAYTALISYKDCVGPALYQARPDIYTRLEKIINEYAPPDPDLSLGGAVTVNTQNANSNDLKQSFQQLIEHRHSVRIFTERHVPDNMIFDAVKLAQRTPSVCNRQCWYVHVFTSPADKSKILKHQNGNEGFGHLADRVLLITADLRSFLSSGERHQALIDSGMFAMTLVLAFEAQGISSCCLNLCFSASQEIVFRRESGISGWEVPIMLILIGYPPESLRVAVSARKNTESMLQFHKTAQ